MTPRTAQTVTYVSADGPQYALLVKSHDEGVTADLLVADENGAWTRREGVPRRDPADYGPEGGGHTYH